MADMQTKRGSKPKDTKPITHFVQTGGHSLEERDAFYEAHLKVCKRTIRKSISAPSQTGCQRSLNQSKRLCARNHWLNHIEGNDLQPSDLEANKRQDKAQ